MKKLLTLCFIFSLSVSGNAQKQAGAKDSIKVFYDGLFSVLKKGYLHSKQVNWPAVEAETRQKLSAYGNFGTSLGEIKPLFDKIGANHCGIYYQQKRYVGSGKTIPKDAYTDQLKKKLAAKPAFEARMLNDRYAYILMPAMVFLDTSASHISSIAQPMYDQIAALKTTHHPQGWIVDLRLNTGGNSMPMLLALYDLLGDNAVWGTLDHNKKQENLARLKQGKYLDNSKIIPSIKPSGELVDQAKVAVITGIFTASSGKITALAFQGRPNTIFIGEKSYGAMTSNIQTELPFGAVLALTIGYDSDRNGVYHEEIVPDVLVSKLDNFDDLTADGNVQEAVKFFEGK